MKYIDEVIERNQQFYTRESQRYMGMLLEQFQDRLSIVGEWIKELPTRSEVKEMIRTETDPIRKDIQILKSDVYILKTDVQAIKDENQSFKQEMIQLRKGFNIHERRLTTLEEKIA